MSLTAIVGRPDFSCVHTFPPSEEKKIPNSVPANRRSGFTKSWAIVCTLPFSGKLPEIEIQDFPLSVLFNRYGLKSSRFILLNEANTTLPSKFEGHISLTYVYCGTPGNSSILLQVFASSETWIKPSSVPAYRRFSLTGDSVNETIVPKSEVD